jgi:hypothetical protein
MDDKKPLRVSMMKCPAGATGMTEEHTTPWLYASVLAISVGRSMENPKDIAHQATVTTGVTAPRDTLFRMHKHRRIVAPL